MSGLEQIKERASTVRSMAARHGARNIRIFGSIARGEDDKDSDIDLLVDMDDDRSLMDLVAVERELGKLLNRKVDVVVDGGVSPYLRDRIFAEAVSL
ncbi:MAG: nucleotidyltransferase domain-containing protein [Lentisphaerae bacterium]|nr:nucleotidyltransferase domain-containing protein [Lentisphaerota bacterium]